MKPTNRFLLSSLITVSLVTSAAVHAATETWTTGTGTADWNTAGNWTGTNTPPISGDSLVFGSTTGTTTLNNDFTAATAGFHVGSITFNSSAPAYTIGGNSIIGVLGGITTNGTGTSFVVNSASGVTQTINTSFTLYQNAVSITGSGNLTLGGAITKGGTWNPFLQMNGTGVLTLNGATTMNTAGGTSAYQFNSGMVVLAKSVSGALNVGFILNGSTVKLAATEQLRSTGSVTINGGTLDLNGFDSQTTPNAAPALNGTGGLITNNAAGTGTNLFVFGAALTTSSFGGTISDGATAKVGVTVNDNGPNQNFAVLSGRNNYSGGTTINSQSNSDRTAILSIADVASIGSVGNRRLTFQSNAATIDTALQLTGTAVTNSNQFDALTFTSGRGAGIDVADSNNTFTLGQNAASVDITMTGAATFQKRGAGTLVVASNLAYTGITYLLGGTLKIDAQAGGALASTTAPRLGGGDLYLLGKTSGTTTQTLGNVSLGTPDFDYPGIGAAKITVDANGGAGTTLALGTMANSTVAGATLNIKVGTNATVTTTTTSVTNNLLGNGRIVFTDASDVVNFAAISASGTPRTIQAATYASGLPTSGSTSTANYSHTDNASVTADESVNALKLTTSTTGQSLAIDPGQTLTLTSGGLLFTGADAYSISGGTLKSNTATNSDLIVHQYGAGALTIGSVIANGNGKSTLTKAGPGTLALSGANTYTGLTLVTGGILSISSDSNIGGTNGTFANLTSSNVSPSVTYTGSLPTGFVVGSTMLGKTVTAINTGTSTITLSGNAGTNLTAGTASWAYTTVGATEYGNSGLLLNSGGVLQATSTFSLQESNTGGTAGTTTVNRPVTIGSGGGGFDVTGANTLTIPGNISAFGMMSKSGTGTLVLAGSNGMTGGLTINDGTVRQGITTALGSSATSNLIFGSGTTAKFQLNNFDAKVTSLVSSNTNAIMENGSATAGTKTLTVYNGADNTFAGKLQNGSTGALALSKTGGGTLTLTNTNTYTGGTTINNGKLISTVVGALGGTSGALTMAGGTLDLNALSQTVGAVSITQAPTSGDAIQNGTLTGTSFAASNPTGTATVSAILAGSAMMAKSGAGTLALSAANTYTGTTTVTNGLIQLNVGENAGTNGPLGKPTTMAGSIVLQGGGLQFTSNNTYDYTTSSRLRLADASTNTIDTNGQTVTFSNAIGVGTLKTGALTKVGTGTLTLSGANTYTGNTTVSAGTLALVGGSQASPITISSGAALGFTLGSATTSNSTVTFSGINAKVSVSGTPAAATLLTTTIPLGITGTPVLDPAIPGYALAIEDGGTTLKLKVAGYSAWASFNGAGANLADDHDNDGVSNGVEYFIGGPSGPTTGFTPVPGVTSALTVTWVKGPGYAGTYGTDFIVETSTTLAAGSWTTETLGVNVIESGSNVTYTFPPGPVKAFARLKVTGP